MWRNKITDDHASQTACRRHPLRQVQPRPPLNHLPRAAQPPPPPPACRPCRPAGTRPARPAGGRLAIGHGRGASRGASVALPQRSNAALDTCTCPLAPTQTHQQLLGVPRCAPTHCPCGLLAGTNPLRWKLRRSRPTPGGRRQSRRRCCRPRTSRERLQEVVRRSRVKRRVAGQHRQTQPSRQSQRWQLARVTTQRCSAPAMLRPCG